MKVSEQRQGAVTILRPDGALILGDVQEFAAHVNRAVGSSMGRLVIDMSDVAFIDSAGLELLLDVTEKLGETGQSLRLCHENKTIREVLQLTDLDQQFDHFEDLTTAVRSFL
ncbi:MAG TPA: STAS domain-containing protein [Tepidisphaeraceae bacterium]|jgi:anti-anti-sigma factor|nr:STAS domain-containing protein [Tepidisphaeraceae bacterium]